MFILSLILSEESPIKSTVDENLIIKISEGDMEALQDLYNQSYDSVYGFALSILKNTHDAEDVLQDTFLAIHRNAASYVPKGKPMAWILTITKNFALMKMRSKGREMIAEEFVLENTPAFSELETIEEKAAVKALLEVLSEEERQIVMLHAVAGLKNREIASLLGVSLGTVLSKYHRAIKKISEREEIYNG